MAKIKATKTESVKLKCVLTTHRPKKPVLVYFCPRENKSICFISSYPAASLTQSRSGLVWPWQCSKEGNKEALYSCAGAVKILLWDTRRLGESFTNTSSADEADIDSLISGYCGWILCCCTVAACVCIHLIYQYYHSMNINTLPHHTNWMLHNILQNPQ